MQSIKLPVLLQDKQKTKYRVRSNVSIDEQPLIILEEFKPRCWNQGIEDASDDDFIQIAATESSDIAEFIEDYLGETEMI